MSVATRLLPVVVAAAAVLNGGPVGAAGAPVNAELARGFAVKVVGSGQRSMILIPGLLSSGDVWDPVVAHFATSYRVHVVTLAGFAGVPSAAEPNGSRSFLLRVRDDLIAYVHAEGLVKPVLVGHSLGATLAMSAASAEPASFGAVVAVDGAPFVAALMNPHVTPADVMRQAEQLRVFYRTLTPEQLEQQTRLGLKTMVSDTGECDRLAAWAKQSDPVTVGEALYDVMTTDLRSTVNRIESDLLVVAAGKAFAASPNGVDAVRRAYEAQVSGVARHTVVVAERALHFIMLDDPAFLVNSMDTFLRSSVRR